MPSPEDVLSELEADRASRESELRLIERMISTNAKEEERDMLKRSLVLLLYSHLEGFCKFSLLSYASAINAEKLRCSEAIPAVAAASLSKIFGALRDPLKKHQSFRRSLPDDAFLHLNAREQEFVGDVERFMSHQIQIPDAYVDTKSNVNADVLKKLLYQLGLDIRSVEAYRSSIDKLLGVRNHIAHGDRFKVPTDVELGDYVNCAFAVMGYLQGQVYDALSKGQFRKTAA